MIGNQDRVSDKSGRSIAWQRTIRGAVYAMAALFTVILVWLVTDSILSQQKYILARFGLTTIFVGVLAMLLERCFANFRRERKRRYRLAFWTSGCIGAAYWVIQFLRMNTSTLSSLNWTGILWYICAPSIFFVLGAFCGILAATSLNEGLWENNSPPAEYIQREVYQRHCEVIGNPAPTSQIKRAFDISLALLGAVISAPVWGLSALVIWLEEPGPILFVKNSVGKGGINFHQYKFRTMVSGAEESTGPVLSEVGDERVLLFGNILRKTALDELPQLVNILRGEMSFVGPRPQRTVLVYGYLQEMPEYAERHLVLPGLAGLAQVAGDYYLTARQKLRFDRLYIRHASLGYDLKLLFLAFLVTFWYRWQKNWDGRLPRGLMHARNRRRK